jgi:uncharacterized protein (DUF362 family)
MSSTFSRRGFFGTSAGLLLASRTMRAAAPQTPVALTKGDNRRTNVTSALELIDKEVTEKLKGRKSVIIKPNNVSTNRQLAASHVDSLNGILDYLEKRWKGPVYIAESSAGYTLDGFANFKYAEAVKAHPGMKIELVDLNEEGLYEYIPLIDGNLHAQPCRLAKRLCDPDAFVISAAMLKTHNVAICTLNVKNMALGAPLHSKRSETPRWNDKRIYHGGVRQTLYNMMLTAQKLSPAWGVGVIDGFEGMEGNGPSMGTPVDSRLAIASTDFVAADRIGVEAMGVDPSWIGSLIFCERAQVGVYDRAKIDLRGEKLEPLIKKYRLHADIERELQWMGDLKEIPPKLG